MPLTLYYHPLASYCHKVLIALYEHDTPFERRIIDLSQPGDRDELTSHWPLCKFPVIHDSDRQRDVAETTIIIEYLDQHHPGVDRMIPADRDDALDVRLWDRIFDNHVQGPMQAIVNDKLFNGGQGDMSGHKAALTTAYKMADRHLAARTWVGRSGFSLADCAAAPALFYAMTLQPFPDDASNLHAYFERLVARPSVKRVLDEAKPYLPMYPFFDAVPARFR